MTFFKSKSQQFAGYFFAIIGIMIVLAWFIYSRSSQLRQNDMLIITWAGYLALFLLLFAIAFFFKWVWFEKADQAQLILRPEITASMTEQGDDFFSSLKSQLKRKHGVFWRRKQCWLLVLGTEPQAEHLAPGLTSEGWQESHEAVLLWGGGRDGRFG